MVRPYNFYCHSNSLLYSYFIIYRNKPQHWQTCCLYMTFHKQGPVVPTTLAAGGGFQPWGNREGPGRPFH